MTSPSEAHPYCAVVVTIIPLDEQGRPLAARTVIVSGTGGPIGIEPEQLTIEWRPGLDGTRFTINGVRERL